MVEELLALSTAEDRLSFLMERPHQHGVLAAHERTDSCKVPGCLSGLWLKAEVQGQVLLFSAFSESDLVHGVVSFMCDLYSNRTASTIAEIGSSLVDVVKLDGLLSTTRKRALSSTLAFIQHSAQAALASQQYTTMNAA
jgi:cysteine desulfuration protein SufE